MSDGMDLNGPITTSPDSPRLPTGTGKARLWQDDEFSFGDVLDAINPLQHLPVIGSLYRAVTGDKIGTLPRVIGDFAFGGFLGFLGGIISVGIEDQTGKDPGAHLIAMVEEAFSDAPPADAAHAARPDAAPPAGLAPQLAAAIEVRLDEPATTVAGAPPGLLPPAAAKPAATLASAGPADGPAKRAGAMPALEVKPDHPPMPLVRNGGGSPVAQSAVVPLQSATVIPRPPTLAARPAPVDVPKQMMDALDKYARFQNARGSRVDLTN
jgi:hypothetical protein